MADPTDVTGLLRRWRADTIAQSNNTAVSSWSALTGGGALAQATGSRQPLYITSGINGLPVVRFDGSDDLLTQTISSVAHPITWVLMAKLPSTGTSWRQVVQCGSEIWLRNTDGWTFYAGLDVPTSIETTNPVVMTSVMDTVGPNVAQIYLDGTQRASGPHGSLATGTTLAVGNHGVLSRPYNGDVAELLLYDHALTAAERATVHSYVQDRYAIPVSDYLGSAPIRRQLNYGSLLQV